MWVLAPVPLDVSQLVAGTAGLQAMVTEPEPGSRLMERARLLREPAPPASIAVFPVSSEEADDVFDAVVSGLSGGAVPEGVRVLTTTSRRVR